MEAPLNDFDYPSCTIGGEVIPTVANFKKEGLVTLKGWKGEN